MSPHDVRLPAQAPARPFPSTNAFYTHSARPRTTNIWCGSYQAGDIAENKLTAALDSCFESNGDPNASSESVWNVVLDDAALGACTAEFPTSRRVAGGWIEGSIFKRAPKPLSTALSDGTYRSWSPSAGEVERLNEILPDGVCDFSQPDRGRPRG
ncbi:DUF6351 family protein [Halopseudomonas nanhaiensis]|uniref:DUF6351 family protein n=1 Tax=Halopseudomonas nanhaiensis TaxID=2830842 RepID=UPI001CC0B506